MRSGSAQWVWQWRLSKWLPLLLCSQAAISGVVCVLEWRLDGCVGCQWQRLSDVGLGSFGRRRQQGWYRPNDAVAMLAIPLTLTVTGSNAPTGTAGLLGRPTTSTGCDRHSASTQPICCQPAPATDQL